MALNPNETLGSPKILGVILAGGRSHRMGGVDKAFQKLGAQSLLDHVVSRLKSQVDQVILNANGNRFDCLDLPVIQDTISGQRGPLAGILAAMEYAQPQGFDYVLSAAVDTPFFPLNLRQYLLRGQRAGRLTLAASCGSDGMRVHPTFGLWPVLLRQDLRSYLISGQSKMISFAELVGNTIVEFPVESFDPFFNINTPADLDMAEEIRQNFT